MLISLASVNSFHNFAAAAAGTWLEAAMIGMPEFAGRLRKRGRYCGAPQSASTVAHRCLPRDVGRYPGRHLTGTRKGAADTGGNIRMGQESASTISAAAATVVTLLAIVVPPLAAAYVAVITARQRRLFG